MTFTVIIATFDRPDRLARVLGCVSAASRKTGEAHPVVVVDNGSRLPAGPIASALSASTGLSIRCLASRPGDKCRALNMGIAAASTEWLAFTDDDTLPDGGWLAEGARFAAAGGCRVFGGRVLPGEPPGLLPAWLQPGRSGRFPWVGGALVRYEPMSASGRLPRSHPIPFGANIFVRRDVFAEFGGYDETLWALCGRAALGVDDGEFGVRLQSAGEPIGYCREALVVHPVHEERYSIASHLRIAYRYGWRDPLVFFDPRRPAVELFRLRQVAGLSARAAAAALRRDAAAAVSDLSDAAKAVGAVACRQSRAYREWARLRADAYRAPAPGAT